MTLTEFLNARKSQRQKDRTTTADIDRLAQILNKNPTELKHDPPGTAKDLKPERDDDDTPPVGGGGGRTRKPGGYSY